LHAVSGKRALVIEDDSTISRLTAALMRRAGFRPVDIAGDGVEALELLRKYTYCVATLDLRMPRMSGYEMLEELKRNPLANCPKIIVATADKLYRERDLDPSLVTAVLTKPFDIQTFITTVRSCLA
jgi:chemosensory pili system protein ChpA (sensor histidine kinase/response regulator)